MAYLEALNGQVVPLAPYFRLLLASGLREAEVAEPVSVDLPQIRPAVFFLPLL